MPATPPLPPDPNPSTARRWLGRAAWITVVAMLVGSGWAIHDGHLQIPARLDPWSPLDVGDEPNFLTGFKLERARSDPRRCLAALAGSGMAYTRVPDRSTGEGCGLDSAVRLRAGRSIVLGSPTLFSCRAALSFAMWERHALQPAARRHFGDALLSIEHLGSYACRNVNTGGESAASARRSRHATADALDVSGFTRGNRQRIAVLKNWHGADVEARFLKDAHAGACRFFDGVLGPDYNAVHADHFHLEIGGWRTCR